MLPDSNSPKILSVVIVNYNVCDFVLEAIESLVKYVKCRLEIIVVDNNSIDKSVEIIQQKFPKVNVISNQENLGFSRANNIGFEKCTGDYVLMFNPDAVLIDDSINVMILEMEKHLNRDVLLGPKLVNTDNSDQVSCWKFPSPIQHLLELFFLNTLVDLTKYNPELLERKREVDFLSGACILFSKETLHKLKGLDVNLFWMDDVDFGKRNLENGGVNYYFPLSTVKHHIGQSSKKNQNIVISNQIISKLKFYRKHRQYLYFVLSVPIFVLQILSRIPLFFVLGLVGRSYFEKCRAYTYTFSRFFKYLFLGHQQVI